MKRELGRGLREAQLGGGAPDLRGDSDELAVQAAARAEAMEGAPAAEERHEGLTLLRTAPRRCDRRFGRGRRRAWASSHHGSSVARSTPIPTPRMVTPSVAARARRCRRRVRAAAAVGDEHDVGLPQRAADAAAMMSSAATDDVARCRSRRRRRRTARPRAAARPASRWPRTSPRSSNAEQRERAPLALRHVEQRQRDRRRPDIAAGHPSIPTCRAQTTSGPLPSVSVPVSAYCRHRRSARSRSSAEPQPGMDEPRQLERQEPPEVGALLDVGDLVGAVLDLRDRRFAAGDALEPARPAARCAAAARRRGAASRATAPPATSAASPVDVPVPGADRRPRARAPRSRRAAPRRRPTPCRIRRSLAGAPQLGSGHLVGLQLPSISASTAIAARRRRPGTPGASRSKPAAGRRWRGSRSAQRRRAGRARASGSASALAGVEPLEELVLELAASAGRRCSTRSRPARPGGGSSDHRGTSIDDALHRQSPQARARRRRPPAPARRACPGSPPSRRR